MQLSGYRNSRFSRGRPLFVEVLWNVVQALFVSSWIPGSFHRRLLLRLFGARIGQGVVIKPGVRVKFPWRLIVGAHSWIGEDVWIDNLAVVRIGRDSCISQGAYLCTGSHDWKSESFDLIVRPIDIRDQVWVCAKTAIGPGVEIGEGAVVVLGSVVSNTLEAGGVYQGNPAVFIKNRGAGYSKPEAEDYRRAS